MNVWISTILTQHYSDYYILIIKWVCHVTKCPISRLFVNWLITWKVDNVYDWKSYVANNFPESCKNNTSYSFWRLGISASSVNKVVYFMTILYTYFSRRMYQWTHPDKCRCSCLHLTHRFHHSDTGQSYNSWWLKQYQRERIWRRLTHNVILQISVCS